MMKVLFVATIYGFLDFEKSDMEILQSMGCEVHTAANMYEYTNMKDRSRKDAEGIIKHHIGFARRPFSWNSVRAFKQLKCLLNENHFDLIHCHTPVAAAIARLAARKTRRDGTKVMYTDHGFHFHKSSGWKNWALFYPIEYYLAKFTDMILTVNMEDFHIIQKFRCPIKRYIPGVGVDVGFIQNLLPDKERLRQEFHIPQDAFLVITGGEFSFRKNQSVIIRALSLLNDPDVYYLLCGRGDLENYLRDLAKELGVEKQVIIAGSIPHELYVQLGYAADVGALPSLIEGLGLAGIEALAAGIPVVGAGVHGIKDYVIDGETGFRCDPKKPEEFCDAIKRLKNDKSLYEHCCLGARMKSREFDIRKVRALMKKNYQDVLNI